MQNELTHFQRGLRLRILCDAKQEDLVSVLLQKTKLG